MFSSGRRVPHPWASCVDSQINVTDYEKLRYRPRCAAVKKNPGSFKNTIESGIVYRRELVYVSGNVMIAKLPGPNYLKEILP
jgi:hypothetical protein